jgi:hypothetical protein
MLETSYSKGYLVRCRRARCSLSCNANWAKQHGACLARHLQELDGQFKQYRGHLRMPVGSKPADHARTKRRFLEIMNRWKSKNGYTFEVHAVLDITSATEAHWDTTAYSNAPVDTLRTVVSEAWERAGGLRQSLVAMEVDELVGQCKYQTKDTAAAHIQRDRGVTFLPAEQSVCGINNHWSTAGFWAGRTIKSIWAELVAEWFGDADDDGPSNKENTTLDATDDPATSDPTPESVYRSTRELAEFRRDISARLRMLDNPRTLSTRIWEKLPHDKPQEAPTVLEVSKRWGLGTAHIRSLLIGLPGAVRIEGGRDWGVDDRYWIDTSLFNEVAA